MGVIKAYTGLLYIGLSVALLISSCRKDNQVLPDDVETDNSPYDLRIPAFFPKAVDMPDNPLTEAGVELGRHLFYEPMLSATNTVSCATCHRQEKGFSDGLVLSNTGISGKALKRHSPALFNLAWADQGFFWDGGSKNLESQAFAPLAHPDEMGSYFPEMLSRLSSKEKYITLFQKAFNEAPSAAGVAKALAQFQRTIISAESRYDLYRRGKTTTSLNASEVRGMNLVQQKCADCHSGELFTDKGFHNNGIDDDFSDDSHEEIYLGRYRMTRAFIDIGAFKTPSLRNVMVSAPYMHDGRFSSIDEVLEHYRSGIKESLYTDKLLYQSNGNVGIPMTDQDVKDIKAFLSALTDEEFLKNKQYSNPNKED